MAHIKLVWLQATQLGISLIVCFLQYKLVTGQYQMGLCLLLKVVSSINFSNIKRKILGNGENRTRGCWVPSDNVLIAATFYLNVNKYLYKGSVFKDTQLRRQKKEKNCIKSDVNLKYLSYEELCSTYALQQFG